MDNDPHSGSFPREPVLYGYWRSSCSYRVRIALNLKGIAWTDQAVHLVRDGGEQNSPEFREINPLGLVPALIHEGQAMTQSIAILEYIDETFPGPQLLPEKTSERARVRAIAQSIACEIQPMNNLSVINFMRDSFGLGKEETDTWYRTWITRGFSALETMLAGSELTGTYCHGEQAGMADCCLVPQVYNAERFDCNLDPYPEIRRITEHCRKQPEFISAAPENQPDAVL
jgi:maleylacetoacetate isomerase